jgi:ribosomal protein S12 methylthiotransferase accessory factor
MLSSLVSPAGVVSSVRQGLAPRGLSHVDLRIATAGSGRPGRGHGHGETGSGRAFADPELARVVAIAEAAERYAGANLHDRPVLARASDLDGDALDLGALPRCSAAEYSDPDCPVAEPGGDPEIRWLRGTDLSTGEPVWVPAVMACYGLPPLPAERFWYQISTGTAVHTSYARALTGAVSEVVERDMIAVLWLQKLPVPPLDPAVLTDTARHLIGWSERHFVSTAVFDATGDLGVPTAYVLQTAPHDDRAHRIVGCGTGATIGIAAEKALFEAVTLRDAFYTPDPLPAHFRDFTSVVHSARYMAQPSRAEAFGFLLDGISGRPVSSGPPALPEDPDEQLRHLIRALDGAGLRAFAVDRTPRELAAAGLVAVSVVIPGLQPMSLHPLAQFRAGPRLYSLPARLGHRTHAQEELNPWPQPFA